jgi:hypothetical protein
MTEGPPLEQLRECRPVAGIRREKLSKKKKVLNQMMEQGGRGEKKSASLFFVLFYKNKKKRERGPMQVFLHGETNEKMLKTGEKGEKKKKGAAVYINLSYTKKKKVQPHGMTGVKRKREKTLFRAGA